MRALSNRSNASNSPLRDVNGSLKGGFRFLYHTGLTDLYR